MKNKNDKVLLTIGKSEINDYITYLLKARNTFIEQGRNVEYVNGLLDKMLRIKKKLRA